MSVQSRLVGTFVVVTLLLLIPAGLAVERLTSLHQLAVEGREEHAQATLALGRFETALSQLDRYQRSYLATGDEVVIASARVALEDLEAAIPSLGGTLYLDSGAQPFLSPIVQALADANARIEELVEEGRYSEATEIFREAAPLMGEARSRLTILAEGIDRHAQQDFERAHDIISSTRSAVPLLLLFCVVLTVLLGAWAVHAIVTPLRRLAGAMTEVTEGVLRAPEDLPYRRLDEIGDLAGSFRTMTRRLAELDRMKAEFLGVAIHELKTPISIISGYGELVEEELAEELTEHQREIFRGISEQTAVMIRLMSRLMDISRLESGSYDLELQPAHIEDLVTGLARAFDVVGERKNVKIKSRIHASAPESVVMDVDLIRDEVLGNLLSNAVKFIPAGEEIEVEVWGEENAVVFQVSDTGPGIPEEHRPHIFEKHYQVERSRRLGSGLGLAIAREMVELHGGRVDLLDTPSSGATFQVRLPCDLPAGVGPMEDLIPWTPSAPPSIPPLEAERARSEEDQEPAESSTSAG